MQRTCDICGEREATLFDRVIENNKSVEYAYCEACYTRALKAGKNPHEEAQKRLARRGKECKFCGCDVEEFQKTFLFGCAHCYEQMRGIAVDSALKAQHISQSDLHGAIPLVHVHSTCDLDGSLFESKRGEKEGTQYLKSANECSIGELLENNVISSRIRLARNIKGLEFPSHIKVTDQRCVDLMNSAYFASQGIFNARLLPMSRLTKEQKKALIERHIISLNLANNDSSGAVIVEGDTKYGGISVMVNEEDHIREQCVVDGFNLAGTFERLHRYDVNLIKSVPVAYDEQLGFLTACPTNLGTGMRASVMLFLPALKRAGAIEDALKTFKTEFGLTIRGVFGEGSEAAYDMYQVSNSRTLGVSEESIIGQVEQAAVRMCYCERVALERLVRDKQTELLDGISRSYAVLKSAYALTSKELMKLLVDVKLGVILGILPIKNTRKLDETIWSCTSSSLSIITGGNSDEERDKMRAQIVRKILAEDK